jgi:predicted GTPase
MARKNKKRKASMRKERVIILGAAGRDFHNFNTLYRNNDDAEVVAFTATQIPNIEGRRYPTQIAGKNYPSGIPIIAESSLAEFLGMERVDTAVFSYSDVSYEYVMQLAAKINALGVDFRLLASDATMLESTRPVVAVCAVRTGSGKSQTTRRVAEILRGKGYRVAVVRHPMPYGDLTKQVVQRFAGAEDLERHECTIEEREEYEHHIESGNVVFAGVDYEKVLSAAEKESDIVLWDGGNNDLPFFRPDLWITIADPHRAGHEIRYYPGEINVYKADVVIVNKVDTARPEDIEIVIRNVRDRNPAATIIRAASPVSVQGDACVIRGKRVLCVEDGPTLTHGGMTYGAAVVAAKEHGAAEIIDPRPYAVGTIKKTFEIYPGIGKLLPAMGYSDQQIEDLTKTIDASNAELVIVGTPIRLARIAKFSKPSVQVTYRLEEMDEPGLEELLDRFVAENLG